MKVELTPDAEAWVRAEVEAGKYGSPEEAINEAVSQAKLSALRATIQESIARGGSNTAADVLAHVERRSAARRQAKAS